jgi:hypothetical protein
MCMALQRRLHLLLDEARYRRVAAAARRRQTSVAAVIREAIDEALPDDADRKRAAAKAILASDPIPLPDDPAELKREIREARSRGL